MSQSRPTRDNLPAQHKVIAICCCCVLRDTFRVHCPCGSASGLSTLQLKTFASLEYTVPYFSLGRIPYFWLILEEDSGRYYMGLRQLWDGQWEIKLSVCDWVYHFQPSPAQPDTVVQTNVDINKLEGCNLVFTNHGKEDGIYPLRTKNIL